MQAVPGRFQRHQPSGFTLIEVMITVAIIGILSAIAMPSYTDYVLRGKLVEATGALQTLRTSMEQYYQDNRTYVGAACTTTPSSLKYFVVTCGTPSASAYTLTATGSTTTAGFIYTIRQDGSQTSTVSAAWDSSQTVYACWIMKRGATCTS